MFNKISIIIPVYNEEKTIASVIHAVDAAELSGIEKEIIVVDDGSTDGTRTILGELGKSNQYRIIFQEKNQGKGAAIKCGLGKATGELVLIQDADLEYDPADYPALLQPILSGEAEVTIGSRTLNKPGSSARIKWHHPHPLTYIGNLLIIWLIKLLYQRPETDFFSCYKIVPCRFFAEFNIEADNFSYDLELLCKIFRRGISVKEVPIHYNPRTFAEGKKIRYKDGFLGIWTIIQWRFRRLP